MSATWKSQTSLDPELIASLANRGLIAHGTTVPADATIGYQTGCVFIHRDGGASTSLYVNEGTVDSADFNPILTAVTATGVKLAGGEVTLDGSNPTPVTTGLTTVLAASASLKQTSAPGDDPSWLSVDYTGGTLNIYAWKNTGGTDPTLVASTNNTAVISWLAIGV